MRRLLVLVAFVTPAAADDDYAVDEPGTRGIHGSLTAGDSLLITGADGDRFRSEISGILKPRSRYGIIAAWRGFDGADLGDGEHDGMLMAGLVFEGGAARPRLVLDLVGEVGWDLDQSAPVIGAGIHTTVGIIGPLAVTLHSAIYAVIDGDDTRIQLQGNLLVGVRF